MQPKQMPSLHVHRRRRSLAMTLLILATLLLSAFKTTSAAPNERAISIVNESGRRVEVYWIHPDTGEMVLQSTPDILAGATFALNSYVGHAFEVRELPAKKTAVCGGEGDVCRVDHFTVNENSDQSELYAIAILCERFCLCSVYDL